MISFSGNVLSLRFWARHTSRLITQNIPHGFEYLMKNLDEYKTTWENDEVHVNVPFSAAGVSTTIVLTSKFTGKMMLMDVGDGAIRDLLISLESSEFINEIDLIAISIL